MVGSLLLTLLAPLSALHQQNHNSGANRHSTNNHITTLQHQPLTTLPSQRQQQPMPPPPSNDAAAALDKLAETNTLSLDDSLPWLSHVRANGVRQFISNLEKHENLTADELRWGDEVEFLLLRYDDDNRRVQLNLRASQVLVELQASEEAFGRRDGFGEAAAWHPEYAAWMIEGTPRAPFGGLDHHD